MTKESSINFNNSVFSGNIVQGQVHGNIETNVNNEATFENELSHLLKQLAQINIEQTERAALETLRSNVAVLESTQTKHNRPSTKDKAALKAIKSVLSSTAGSTAATGVIGTIDRLLSHL